jgi:predicted nucleic acid-binding protein
MILVDSSVWIDHFNGVENPQTDFLHIHLGEKLFVTGDLIMMEVLQGFRANKDFYQAKNLMSHLPSYDMVGQEIALKSAQNYRALNMQEYTVRKSIGVLIATFCMENDLMLLHNVKDYKMVESALGLSVVEI